MQIHNDNMKCVILPFFQTNFACDGIVDMDCE